MINLNYQLILEVMYNKEHGLKNMYLCDKWGILSQIFICYFNSMLVFHLFKKESSKFLSAPYTSLGLESLL